MAVPTPHLQRVSTRDISPPTRYSAAVRRCCLFLLLCWVVGCTSAWDRRQSLLAEHEGQGKYVEAAADARWLIDNAFYRAPPGERTSAAAASRYLRLATLAAKAGNAGVAVEALREAVRIDPRQGPAIRAQLEQLPVTETERTRLRQEFRWNITALAPRGLPSLQAARASAHCWSYHVEEVRKRRYRTVSTPEGKQHEVTYDARPWVFDAEAGQWRPVGPWKHDAGMETEDAQGPQQPRYRALLAPGGRFYASETVPPCHRAGWEGPYGANGTVFVATRLPSTAPAQ
ncbi:MAG: hypothetical protein ACE5I7_14020 [Candidatus Binatia bacterium]